MQSRALEKISDQEDFPQRIKTLVEELRAAKEAKARVEAEKRELERKERLNHE